VNQATDRDGPLAASPMKGEVKTVRVDSPVKVPRRSTLPFTGRAGEGPARPVKFKLETTHG